MKKHLLIAAFMLLATSSVFAQEKTTVIIKDNGDSNEKITIVEKIFHNPKIVDPLPGIYYSYENMFTGTFGPEANIPLRSSSFEWGLYGTTPIVATNHFGISTGLGISNAYNYLTHDMVLAMDNENNAYLEPLITYSSVEGHGPANNYAHRSFIRYWSRRAPLPPATATSKRWSPCSSPSRKGCKPRTSRSIGPPPRATSWRWSTRSFPAR